jgi:hypothetical protein
MFELYRASRRDLVQFAKIVYPPWVYIVQFCFILVNDPFRGARSQRENQGGGILITCGDERRSDLPNRNRRVIQDSLSN